MNSRNVEEERIIILLNAILELQEERVILVRTADDEIGNVPRIAVANVFDAEPDARSK